MEVVTVCVSADQYLESCELLSQLQGDLVGGFSGKNLLRGEGLDHVIVHSSLGFSVEPLGVHKLLIGSVGQAVHPGDQVPLGYLIPSFMFLLAVLHRAVQATAGLGFSCRDEFNNCHCSIFCESGCRTADR